MTGVLGATVSANANANANGPAPTGAVATTDVADRRIGAVFAALASGPRRAVLRILAEAERRAAPDPACCTKGDVCACVFSRRLGLSPSTVSHHMHQLVEAGLVSARKEGQWVYYRLERDALEEAALLLRQL